MFYERSGNINLVLGLYYIILVQINTKMCLKLKRLLEAESDARITRITFSGEILIILWMFSLSRAGNLLKF